MRKVLPHAATCGNLAAGFLAMLFAAQADFQLAAALIAAAAVLDLLDGLIARDGKHESEFGSNLDSLADLVSFGATPAFAIYQAVLGTAPFVGIISCLGFFVCGALRLARFPLVKKANHFIGLPIPPAGVLVIMLSAVGPSALLALIVVIVLSALMVSPLPFPKPAAILARGKHTRRERI